MMDLSAYRSKTVEGFVHAEKDGVEYLQSPLISNTGLARHAFFTRKGGVSPAPYDSLNFSLKREGSRSHILANMEKAAETIGVELGKCAIINYAHCPNVIELTGKDAGAGIFKENSLAKSDGFAARTGDVGLITLHADCLPLFFLAPSVPAIALCHAGWRGVYGHIALKAIDLLCEMGAQADDIICAIGPCIGPCCFEVGEDVELMFYNEFGGQTVLDGPKARVDLTLGVLCDFKSAGVKPENVNIAGECTSCNPGLYFSHRRDKGQTGSMASFMQLV